MTQPSSKRLVTEAAANSAYVRGTASATAPTSPSTGDVWVPTSIAPTAAYLGGMRVSRSTGMAAQAIANNGSSAVKFDTVDYDDAAYSTLGTNQTDFTVPASGRYRVTGQVEWAINTTGLRYLNIFKNFATRVAQTSAAPTSDAGSSVRQQIESGVIILTAGDRIQLTASQNNTGAVSLNLQNAQGSGSSFLCIERVA